MKEELYVKLVIYKNWT